MVTVCDRHSLNSARVDVVSVSEGSAGSVTLVVIVIDPPPGHGITLEGPGVALSSTLVARVKVAPTIPWASAGLTRAGGEAVDGADGELPPHPAMRAAAMSGAPSPCARMSWYCSPPTTSGGRQPRRGDGCQRRRPLSGHGRLAHAAKAAENDQHAVMPGLRSARAR